MSNMARLLILRFPALIKNARIKKLPNTTVQLTAMSLEQLFDFSRTPHVDSSFRCVSLLIINTQQNKIQSISSHIACMINVL